MILGKVCEMVIRTPLAGSITACARTRTFLWMALCLAGMTTRKDLIGVTSIVRALGLVPACYDRLLDFFHSPALDLDNPSPVAKERPALRVLCPPMGY